MWIIIALIIGFFYLKKKGKLKFEIPKIAKHIGGMILGVWFYKSMGDFVEEMGSKTSVMNTLLYLYLVVYTIWIYKVIKSFKPIKIKKGNNAEEFEFTSGNGRTSRSIENPYRGTIVIGGAGSGKSKTFIYPIIKQSAEKEFTGVLYDFNEC
jgi:hypothetical protein